MGKKLRNEAKKVAKWLTKSKNGANGLSGQKRGKSPKKGHLPRFGGNMATLHQSVVPHPFRGKS